jgi:replicative DNA helicase
MRIEKTILSNLIHNENYCRKVLPHIDASYFVDRNEKIIASTIVKFFTEFNKPITNEILAIEVGNRNDLNEVESKEIQQYITGLCPTDTVQDWLETETESFCKQRAVYNAIMDSIKIIEGKDKQRQQDAIPSLLSDALAVSFDNHIGHDYLEDFAERWDFYHRVEEKLSFDLDMLNTITKGGLSKKTLNIILAGTGVGKSLFMCHVAATSLMQGKNVLYITMEMAEERIAERIDANLLNLGMDELAVVDRELFERRVEKVKAKTQGKLIVKEYPTASAHSGHFRALLEELKMKREFKPDIVFVDYLNICASSRLRMGANVNSYTYIKSIAEELRGLAGEYNVPIMSATQTTRSGFTNSDPGLEDTSESFGLPATADLMLALVSTEELEELGQIMVKQLKNRYADPGNYKRFVIGVDRSKMKLYNVEVGAQSNVAIPAQKSTTYTSKENIGEDVPLFDRSRKVKTIDAEFNF